MKRDKRRRCFVVWQGQAPVCVTDNPHSWSDKLDVLPMVEVKPRRPRGKSKN